MTEIENEVQTILDALLLLRRKGVLVFAPGVETDATGERATVVIELEEKRLRIHGEGTGARNYVIPLNSQQFAALSSFRQSTNTRLKLQKQAIGVDARLSP
jgi:hypothetical protein